MRRFVKTFFVKRVAQLTVLHDSNVREFEVWKWTAENGLVRVTAFPYAPGASIVAKELAIKRARDIYAEFVPPMICAWCPGFDKDDPKNAGASHGMCPTCEARENRKLDEAGAPR